MVLCLGNLSIVPVLLCASLSASATNQRISVLCVSKEVEKCLGHLRAPKKAAPEFSGSSVPCRAVRAIPSVYSSLVCAGASGSPDFRSLRICADLQDFCRSLQICADLQDFCRSLQICADSKKNDLIRNTLKPKQRCQTNNKNV